MAYRRIAALAIVAAFSPSQGYAQPDKGKPLEVDAAASVGAYAVDLGSGKAIWEYNANRWLTPASVTKHKDRVEPRQRRGQDTVRKGGI